MLNLNNDVLRETWEIFRPVFYISVVAFLGVVLSFIPGVIESACSFSLSSHADKGMNCAEFWFNRYQTLAAGVFALIAAFIGGYYVDKAARFAIERERERLMKIQADACEAAVIAINPCVQAAAVSLSNIQTILKHPGEPELNRPILKNLQDLRLALSKGLEHFSIREISRDLEINARIQFLMIARTLDTYVTIYKIDGGSAQELANMRHALELVGHYVSLFDDDLNAMFARDSQPSSAA